MKKITSKFLATLLSIVMLVSMLPAVSASSDDLRDTVVNQTQSIMDFLWTKQKRNARAKCDFEAHQAGGVRPTIYYESTTWFIPYKGLAVSDKAGSYETFVDMVSSSGENLVDGVPHLVQTDYNVYYGMDMHSFLVDVISRVSADVPTSFKDALTHEAMVSLAGTVNASAADSKSAADTAAVKAAYSKLQKGDILLAWNDNADVGLASNTDSATQIDYPKMHVLVVKEVNGDQVTVMYAGYHQPEWHFICSKCGASSTELTYRGPRKHSFYNKYDTWKGFTTHNETYPESSCTGTWVGQYATTWRTETVSFDQLIGGPAGSNVPYGSDSTYLPYSLAVYTDGSPKADVKATTTVSANSITGGFSANVTSNYRIVGFEAVLTAADGTVQRFPSVVSDWKAWSWDYSDPALDRALMETKSGSYKLDLYVKTGPANTDGSVPGILAYSMDFGLSAASVLLAADKSAVPQGGEVCVTLTTQKAGLTAIQTAVDYDPTYFTFDAAKSQAASPNTTFADNGEDGVAVRYAGTALADKAVPVKMYFTAKRSGNYPVLEGVVPFKLLFLKSSTTKGASDNQLAADRADGEGQMTIGYNTVLYKNYAGGNDLLLVYMSNNDEALVKKTTLPMLYDGKLMDEVSLANYAVDGNSYLVSFGYIGPDLDPLKVSLDTSAKPTNCPEIIYSNDVNGSGVVDVADAQAIMNIANGKLPLEGNVTKWLRADINRDGKVDVKDRNALISALMN